MLIRKVVPLILATVSLGLLLCPPHLVAEEAPPPPPVGTGTGLRGEYYGDNDFTTRLLVRKDPTINFGWGEGSPDPAVPADNFGIRWTGYLQPRFTEEYTFYRESDDGARLWINNQLIFDALTPNGPGTNEGTIKLTVGQKYEFKLEYCEFGGGAACRVTWQSQSQPRDVIPQSQLYPPYLDAGRLVFSDNASIPKSALYLVNTDKTQTRLTELGAAEPSLSRDGTKLVFTSGRHTTWTDPKTVKNTEIYLITLANGNQRRVTVNSAGEMQPRFNADGTKIIFASNRDGNWEIYLMNSEGGRQIRLTEDKAMDCAPAFSPDGKQVVFQSDRDGKPNVYLLDIESGETKRLTDNGGTTPLFSPDGQKIVFTSTRDGNAEIYLMNADGSEQKRLTTNEVEDIDPSFSPTGTEIVFASKRDGKDYDILTMTLDGRGQERLVENQHGLHPSWSF